MGDLKMGAKTVLSQSGTNDPTWGANAPTGTIVQMAFCTDDTLKTLLAALT